MRTVGYACSGLLLLAGLGCDAVFGPGGVPPDFIPSGFPIPAQEETIGGYGRDGGDTFVARSLNGKDLVVFEAEHALDWEDGWFTTDAEPGASGNAYLQVDPGTAFAAGRFVDFKVRFSHEGTWYCWVRALMKSADDNGVYLENEKGELLPMQLCFATDAWHHTSSLRTQTEHCGIRGLVTYEVTANGPGDDLTRVIRFRSRDAGFRFDRGMFVDTLFYIPMGLGPPESDRQ